MVAGLLLEKEITTDAQIFPCMALGAVDALAVEQLSGSFPDYEWLVRGRKVLCPKSNERRDRGRMG